MTNIAPDDSLVIEKRYQEIRAVLNQAQSGNSQERLSALRALVPHLEWLLIHSEATLNVLKNGWNFTLNERGWWGTMQNTYISVDKIYESLGEPQEDQVAIGAIW